MPADHAVTSAKICVSFNLRKSAGKSLVYSDLNEFTGFVVAALIDSKLTVTHALLRPEQSGLRRAIIIRI